jgi:hypothetical protein
MLQAMIRPDQGAWLLPGEVVRARVLANAVQGDRAYGGHLYVTSRWLLFVPNGLSGAHGGLRSEVPLADVVSADVARRGWNQRGGAWRRGLRIVTASRAGMYFVVWRPRKTANVIQLARSGVTPP